MNFWVDLASRLRKAGLLENNEPNITHYLAGIGNLHQNAVHDPSHPEVSNSYAHLKNNVLKQFNNLKNNGYQFHFTDKDPYENSKQMSHDVLNNKALRVYNKADLPQGHPLGEVEPTTGQSYNTLFRAVHDAHGHAFPGNQFGAKGELKAYQEHAKMFPREALPALAAETLAQNAWVNYGPHNPQQLPPNKRPFAEQKAYAFPANIAESVAQGKFPKSLLQGPTNG